MTLVAPSATSSDQYDALAISSRGMPIGPPLVRGKGDTLAAEITRRWQLTRDAQRESIRWYWQNLAFYLGYQWVWWSEQRRSVMPFAEPQRSPVGGRRVRITVNRVGPNILNVMGRLTRSDLTFEVPPSDGADNFVEGAKRSEKVLEAAHRDQLWERVRYDATLACLFAGTSAVSLEWDDNAGTPIQWDNAAGAVELGTGDVRLRSHNVNEFGIEPGVRETRDASWWISGFAMPAGVVQEWFELPWVPRPDAAAQTSAMYQAMAENTSRRDAADHVLVLCYYERPTKRNKKGRYACVVNNYTVFEGPWPFDFDEMNLHLFRQKRIDGKVFGATYVNDSIPIQVAYNHARSVLQEHMKLAATAKIVAPFGSFDAEDLHTAAGDVVWFSPDGTGAVPQYLSPPNLPRWISSEPEALSAELDTIMHVHDVSRGVGFARASAQALTFLAEQDNSGFAHMIFDQKRNWEQIAQQVLTLYGNRAKDTRASTLPLAPGVTERVEWNGAMLQKQYRVNVPIEAVTPKNAAARLATAQDLWDRKILTDPRMFARQVGLPAEEFGQLLDPDAAKANTENLRMLMGIPEHPDPFDDDAQHIAEHNDRCRKTDAYKYATANIRSIVDDHIAWHENRAANKLAKQQALEAAQAGASTVPQGNAPAGSDVPMSEQESVGRQMQAAGMGLTGPGGGQSSGPPAQVGPPGVPTAPTMPSGGPAR